MKRAPLALLIVLAAAAPAVAQQEEAAAFKVVTGYESTPKIHLAMESGEVHGTIANWSTLKAINTDWIKDKKVRILAQWALQKKTLSCRTFHYSWTLPRPIPNGMRCG